VRPRHLRLRAFGAYPGTEEVDFDALVGLGLFAVTGPTGAGKTTLFDAIAFALYGELPADRPLAEVRSHHAAPTERCEVELTFSVEGGSYRVRRAPEQVRPKRRGPGTTVDAATAELHRVDADGTEHPVVSGNRPVTDACVELVGLDAGQFERVVLLPQGRFQQFLLAGTKERRPLLQQLFGTDLYRRAVDELKQRAADLRQRVGEVDAEVDRHRRNAKEHLRAVAAGLADDELDGIEPDDDVDLLWAFWQKLAPGVADAQTVAGRLAEQAAVATRAAEAARAVVGPWDQRARLRQRAETLASVSEEVARIGAQVEAARRAVPVQRAVDDVERATRLHREAERSAAAAARTLADELAAVDLAPDGPDVDPAAADRALGAATVELEQMVAKLARRAEADSARARAEAGLADVVRRRDAAAAELAGLVDQRRQGAEQIAILEPVAGRLEALTARSAAAAELVARRRRLDEALVDTDQRRVAHADAEGRLAEVLAAFVAGAAPRLAAALRAGASCPVCGSTEHPHPAVGDPAAEVDVQALERAQQHAARAASALASATAAVAELTSTLGADAERAVEALVAEHEALVAEQEAASVAARQLGRVRAELDRLAARHDTLQAESAALEVDVATARATSETAEAAVAALDDEVGALDPEALVERGHHLAAASLAVDRHRQAASAVVAARGARDRTATTLAEALSASGFDDQQSALDAVVAPSELARLERQVTEHAAAVVEVHGGLATLADVDLPDDRPDAEGLEAVAAELRSDEARARSRVQELLTRGSLSQAAILEARRVHDTAAGLRDLRERTERVAALCDGKGPGRIGLETWVLAGELEQVTAAANVHLARMTAGRYQLERTDDAGHRAKQAGLELRVLDSHTGRARPPATLSGGEQFQASLALALGLADVVSAGGVASGRRVEALFVDEGFGSLDPEALDQAVDALHQIRAAGRMVGVITHVDAMKQQLPTGIEVRRRPDGRGSTLSPA
jgi:exonuclease SbcC